MLLPITHQDRWETVTSLRWQTAQLGSSRTLRRNAFVTCFLNCSANAFGRYTKTSLLTSQESSRRSWTRTSSTSWTRTCSERTQKVTTARQYIHVLSHRHLPRSIHSLRSDTRPALDPLKQRKKKFAKSVWRWGGCSGSVWPALAGYTELPSKTFVQAHWDTTRSGRASSTTRIPRSAMRCSHSTRRSRGSASRRWRAASPTRRVTSRRSTCSKHTSTATTTTSRCAARFWTHPSVLLRARNVFHVLRMSCTGLYCRECWCTTLLKSKRPRRRTSWKHLCSRRNTTKSSNRWGPSTDWRCFRYERY